MAWWRRKMTSAEVLHNEAIGMGACSALRRNGFKAQYVSTGAEALELVASSVRPGMTVGLGGSVSLKTIGVPEKVRALGAEVLDHNAPGINQEKRLELRRAQLTCDLFISSSNAVTLEGDIVNVDGGGNRVAALTFGPKRTIVIVGTNKIVRDRDEAFDRIASTAAPMNNKRLDQPNPCVQEGTCQDCDGDTRICRIYHVLHRKPLYSDFTVIVVGEALGY
jgi:L-lactate utilization protein LutB